MRQDLIGNLEAGLQKRMAADTAGWEGRFQEEGVGNSAVRGGGRLQEAVEGQEGRAASTWGRGLCVCVCVLDERRTVQKRSKQTRFEMKMTMYIAMYDDSQV